MPYYGDNSIFRLVGYAVFLSRMVVTVAVKAIVNGMEQNNGGVRSDSPSPACSETTSEEMRWCGAPNFIVSDQ